jgi:hypothetical protein
MKGREKAGASHQKSRQKHHHCPSFHGQTSLVLGLCGIFRDDPISEAGTALHASAPSFSSPEMEIIGWEWIFISSRGLQVKEFAGRVDAATSGC